MSLTLTFVVLRRCSRRTASSAIWRARWRMTLSSSAGLLSFRPPASASSRLRCSHACSMLALERRYASSSAEVPWVGPRLGGCWVVRAPTAGTRGGGLAEAGRRGDDGGGQPPEDPLANWLIALRDDLSWYGMASGGDGRRGHGEGGGVTGQCGSRETDDRELTQPLLLASFNHPPTHPFVVRPRRCRPFNSLRPFPRCRPNDHDRLYRQGQPSGFGRRPPPILFGRRRSLWTRTRCRTSCSSRSSSTCPPTTSQR